MKKKIRRTLLVRILAVILTAVVASGNVTPVYAAQKSSAVTKAGPLKELTGLRVTGLDEPVPGVPFDTGATVVSAEGVSWDIPVIWVDESGKSASVPAAGKKYYPSFVFYVPAGYKISGADAAGRFTVQLPSFVTILSGQSGLIFAADPSTGITYIFCPSGYTPGQPTVPAWNLSQDSHESDSKDSSDPKPDEPEDPISEKVRMYCADNAIDTLGNDFLEWFIDLVKNTLVPQAANLLREKFPESLGSAQSGYELSHNIGLYIYYHTGEIEGTPTYDGAAAFVQEFYARNGYAGIIGFNAPVFTEYNAAAEKWIVDDAHKAYLDNTIIHEMFHAFTKDYNHYGMTSFSPDIFPVWFCEGLATTVQYAFMLYSDEFFQLAEIDPDTDEFYYDIDSVLSGYKNPRYAADFDYARMDLRFSNEIGGNIGSAYVSGYLASVYLGYLDAFSRGDVPVDANGNVNMDVLRGGVDNILKRLHGSNESDAETLDAIINDISRVLDEPYKNTADFQDRFIKGTDGNGDGNGNDNASLAFVATYLDWLSRESIVFGDLANGSILFQDQDYYSPLDWNKKAVSDVYRIPDKGGMIELDVDIRRANLTGGTSTVGDGTQNYVSDDSEGSAAACRTPAAPLSESAAENFINPEPETKPVTDPESASEPVTIPESETISDPDPAISAPEAASQPMPESVPENASDPEDESEPENPSEPQPEPGSASEAAPEPETESIPEAASDPEPASESNVSSSAQSSSK